MDRRSLAEWVGVIAIVASLIFVGLQIQQSQEIALATQYQNRASAVQDLVLAQIEAGHVQPNFRDRVSETISAEDINLFHWLWLSQDNHFFQYNAGFLDEESWQSQRRAISEIYSVCELRFVWEWRRRTGLRRDFVELVESLEDPCDG